MANPKPVPPYRLAVEMSICENDLNSLGSLSGGIPIPVSLTDISNITVVRSTGAEGSEPSCKGLALFTTAADFAIWAVDSRTALDRMFSIFASYMGFPEMEAAELFVWVEFGTYRLILTSIWPSFVNCRRTNFVKSVVHVIATEHKTGALPSQRWNKG